jgi:ribonuclease T1
MRNLKLPLLISALFLAWAPGAFAGQAAVEAKKPAYDFLSELTAVPAAEIAVSSPSAADPARFSKPPCVPSQALTPGRSFNPVVSDARRERAIDDLLAKIAACRNMPYDNDGVVHTDPHNGLPRKPAGYYKEYTLIVPGRASGAKPEAVVIGGVTYMTGPVLSARGPERLMIGDNREVYYTPDHYTTFVYLAIVR